ncbi:hypothetical protein FOCC_FOCC000859 [Frankliniella occidentalis]|nr:hypothetical protein FOCC_FOCC000859 [Frankliniella occidentalis]
MSTYVADIFLAQSWRDPRLRLPENMSEEYRILDVEWLHDIWRPDCFFKNAKKVTFHEMSIPNHYLWLYHDKTLLYMSKYASRHCHSLMYQVVQNDNDDRKFDAARLFQTHASSLLCDEVRVVSARHSNMLNVDRKLIPHCARPRVHLEPDGPFGGEPRDRAPATGHIQQLHCRLYDRVFHGDPEHAVAAVAAARLVRQGHRRVDVVLLRIRFPLAHGVRRGQQLHGSRGHQGHEGLLGGRHPGGRRGHERAGARRTQPPPRAVRAHRAAVRHLLRGTGHRPLHRQVLPFLLPVLLLHPQRRLLVHFPVKSAEVLDMPCPVRS